MEEEYENYDHMSLEGNILDTENNPCGSMDKWFSEFRKEFDGGN